MFFLWWWWWYGLYILILCMVWLYKYVIMVTVGQEFSHSGRRESSTWVGSKCWWKQDRAESAPHLLHGFTELYNVRTWIQHGATTGHGNDITTCKVLYMAHGHMGPNSPTPLKDHVDSVLHPLRWLIHHCFKVHSFASSKPLPAYGISPSPFLLAVCFIIMPWYVFLPFPGLGFIKFIQCVDL